MQGSTPRCYPMWVRHRVMQAGTLAQTIAVAAGFGICEKTVKRWWARELQTGNYEPVAGGAWKRGRARSMSKAMFMDLLWLCMATPSCSLEEMQLFLFTRHLVEIDPSIISRELRAAGMTRKRMRYISKHRDEPMRVRYWTNGPFAGAAPNQTVHGQHGVAGVAGVPVQFLVDLDEASFYVTDTQRSHGYSFKGHNAIERGYGPRDGDKVTVLAAVDVNVGVVSIWTFQGNTDKPTFYLFLLMFLFPALAGQSRCIIMDNLSAHFGADIDDLFETFGHIYVARPVHSPDFGFVEWLFNWIGMWLKRHKGEIDENNLEAKIHQAAGECTPENVQGFAIDAHYYVPGRNFYPYTG